jgi:hypothetical protein
LDRKDREQDTQHGCRHDANHDRARAQLRPQACGGKPDHHRVVPGEHQVDHDHLEERHDRFLRNEVCHAPALRRAWDLWR